MSQSESNERTHLRTEALSIRWGEMDALGHVNNAMYFVYFESVRVNWLREKLGEFSSLESGPVLVHTECQYILPITYPCQCYIEMYARPPGRSSIVLEYEIWSETEQGKTLMTKASSTLVWVDFIKQKSMPLPLKLIANEQC